MIAKTGFAIASEESRYTLNGALMVLKPESITMVATDGHRLAHIERSGEKFEGVSGELKTLIPKKAMDELKSLLDSTDAETIEFAKDESTLYFRIGQRLLTSRQLTGQFPNYEAVLPKDNNKSVTLHGNELSAAISRVAQFADERSRAVRLRLEKGEVKLSASSTETGESEDSHRNRLPGRLPDRRLQRPVHAGLPEGSRRRRRKARVQGSPVRRPAPPRRQRGLQVPLHRHAHADLRGRLWGGRPRPPPLILCLARNLYHVGCHPHIKAKLQKRRARAPAPHTTVRLDLPLACRRKLAALRFGGSIPCSAVSSNSSFVAMWLIWRSAWSSARLSGRW